MWLDVWRDVVGCSRCVHVHVMRRGSGNEVRGSHTCVHPCGWIVEVCVKLRVCNKNTYNFYYLNLEGRSHVGSYQSFHVTLVVPRCTISAAYL